MFKDRAPLSLAFGLIERLSYEPWSLWRANKLGGPEHLGWSPDTYMAANAVDATMMGNALAANSGSKKKAKMPEPISRPKVTRKQKPVSNSIMDIDVRSLQAMMGP